MKHAVNRYEREGGKMKNATAHDVFMILQDALHIMGGKTRSVQSVEKAEEQIAKLLSEKLDWSDYDLEVKPGEF